MITVFDLHCDTPLNIKKKKFHHLHPKHLQPAIFAGAIFAHFIPPREKEPFDAGIKLVLNTIHYLRNKKELDIVDNVKKLNRKKTSIILGVEGGHIFDKNFAQFETFYELGVRVFTLTWNNSNRFAHSAFDDDRKGLTKKGREFIRLLKDYDVLLDLSHASTKTILDVCEIAENLVFASHSCVRRLNPFVRNIDDHAIKAIVERGGIVGINFSKKHLGAYQVFDHIDYLYENFGINAIGIGSDFDGITDPVYSCPKGYSEISDVLKKHHYSKKEIENIFYKNFLKILPRV